jgi:predicted amidophosphoribosyltransferase
VSPVPDRAVLVDDVTTTGATLSACSEALREAGAIGVAAVTLAASRRPGEGLGSRPAAA